MDELAGAFIGGFCGALAVPAARAAVSALRNRQEHKRLMAEDDFRAAWGRNAVSFFLRHGGWHRGL